LGGYASRLAWLLGRGLPKLLWVEKELLPWLPGWLERLLLGRALHVIVDYDDATFHRYDNHARGFIRLALGGKVGRIMAAAEAVIAGNEYTPPTRGSAARAGSWCSRPWSILRAIRCDPGGRRRRFASSGSDRR
jgi:hypothetical protein